MLHKVSPTKECCRGDCSLSGSQESQTITTLVAAAYHSFVDTGQSCQPGQPLYYIIFKCHCIYNKSTSSNVSFLSSWKCLLQFSIQSFFQLSTSKKTPETRIFETVLTLTRDVVASMKVEHCTKQLSYAGCIHGHWNL